MLNVGSLFSGIGGFDLGLERAGMQVKWQVENNSWCQRVLAKHWPDVPRYGDITTIDWATVEPVDLVCGGFPCQPFSVSGKRGGTSDHRYLWPEVVRCLAALRPTWFVGENVPGIVKLALDQVYADLEDLGYAVQACNIPACAVDAPHKRERIWIFANYESVSMEKYQVVKEEGLQGQSGGMGREILPRNCWAIHQPGLVGVAYGVPHRVDRLRGLGNAVVPQIVEAIGRMIMNNLGEVQVEA